MSQQYSGRPSYGGGNDPQYAQDPNYPGPQEGYDPNYAQQAYDPNYGPPEGYAPNYVTPQGYDPNSGPPEGYYPQDGGYDPSYASTAPPPIYGNVGPPPGGNVGPPPGGHGNVGPPPIPGGSSRPSYVGGAENLGSSRPGSSRPSYVVGDTGRPSYVMAGNNIGQMGGSRGQQEYYGSPQYDLQGGNIPMFNAIPNFNTNYSLRSQNQHHQASKTAADLAARADSLNCSPNFIRASMNWLPQSLGAKTKIGIPVGLVVQPLADVEEPIPVVESLVVAKNESAGIFTFIL